MNTPPYITGQLDGIISDAIKQMEANARKAIADALPSLKIGPVICEVSRNHSAQTPYYSTTFFSICVFDENRKLLCGVCYMPSIGEAIGSVIQKLQNIPKP
jgi:hypothetical protein